MTERLYSDIVALANRIERSDVISVVEPLYEGQSCVFVPLSETEQEIIVSALRASQPATPTAMAQSSEAARSSAGIASELRKALAALVACNDAFRKSNGDQAAAYYSMIKGKDALWIEARKLLDMPDAAQPSQQLQEAVAAAHAAFEAIPIGYPLQQNGRTIDHTLLNEAKRLCEKAVSITSTERQPANIGAYIDDNTEDL